MKVLDYYDEKMVDNAYPIDGRKLLCFSAGSCMAALIWGIVYNEKSASEIPIASFILFVICFISFIFCLLVGLLTIDNESQAKVRNKLKEYKSLRKKTLEQHPYKYSINTQEAFAGAKRLVHVCSIGLILFVRFSKTIPKKDKTLAKLEEILKSGISFKTVSDIGCVKDSGQDWYEMDALICTFLTAEERKLNH